jgi:CPA2 family monovalent cation:H+ antiporter-2
VIIAISDPDGTRRIVRLARSMNRDAHIIVRTRYVKQVEALRNAGADEVIPEEFETSLEIVTRTLRVLLVPGNVIASQLRVLRDEGYRLLRDPKGRAMEGRRLAALLTAGTAQTYLIMPGAKADSKTLDELKLEEEHVGVAALLRNGQALAPVPRKEPMRSGDMLVLVGAHEDLTRVLSQLDH